MLVKALKDKGEKFERLGRLIGRSKSYIGTSCRENRMPEEDLKKLCKEAGLNWKDYIVERQMELADIEVKKTDDMPPEWQTFKDYGMKRWEDEDEVWRCFKWYEDHDWKNGKGQCLRKMEEAFFAFEHNNPDLKERSQHNGFRKSEFDIIKQSLDEIKAMLVALSAKTEDKDGLTGIFQAINEERIGEIH